jgi:hypothetical protein
LRVEEGVGANYQRGHARMSQRGKGSIEVCDRTGMRDADAKLQSGCRSLNARPLPQQLSFGVG